jgi:hypothetical protein
VVSSSWAVVVFTLWAIFAAIALLRVAAGLLKLRKLRRNCRSIDVARNPILKEALQELRPRRRTQFCVSDELRMPTAIGFFKPLVILPAWALQDLTPSQLKPVLLHELAHVTRWDDWTNLLQKLIQAILFFHPAVWWIEKRVSLEREMACDDVVLAHTENPRAYAECLLSVAEKNFVRRGFSLAQAAVTRMQQTSLRIAQILNGRRSGTIGIWWPASVLVVASFLLSLVLLPRLPDLVTFSDQAKGAPVAAKLSVPSKSPENSIQVATIVRPLLRTGAHPASFQAKRRFAPARGEAKAILDGRVIEARFPRNAEYPALENKNTAVNRGDVVTQTLFVVTRFEQDGEGPPLWTVHIWQLTVFRPSIAAENTLPEKKV